jgi:hypothetical protein
MTKIVKGVSNFQWGGDHYRKLPIQVWDFIAANKLDYFQGNVVKYVSRYKDKNGLEDLKKSRHYIDKIIVNDFKRSVPCPPQKEAGQE